MEELSELFEEVLKLYQDAEELNIRETSEDKAQFHQNMKELKGTLAEMRRQWKELEAQIVEELTSP